MIVYTCVLHDVFARVRGPLHASQATAAPFLFDEVKVNVARKRRNCQSSRCNEHYTNSGVPWPPKESVSCVTFMPAPRL